MSARRRIALMPLATLVVALAGAFALGALLAPRGDAQDHGRAAPRGVSAPPPSRGHASITAGMDCSACHSPAGWAMSASAGAGRGFDHTRTGFPLLGRHARTSCTQCHRADVHIRRECAACHQDAHMGQLGRDCQRCHDSFRWSNVRGLEMHRSTRLPLTGRPDDGLMKLSEGGIGHGVALFRPVDGHNRNTIVNGIFDLFAHAVPIPDATARYAFRLNVR